MKLIRAQSISKRASGHYILDNISLDVPEECIYGIFGRNGSGKSSLIRVLSGIENPTSGEVTVADGTRTSSAVQSAGLAPDLTVSENLSLIASLARIPRRRRSNRIAQTLQLFSLSSFKNTRASELSMGLLARAKIACAFVVESKLIFIDGLVDVLDSAGVQEIWQAMLARRREDGTAFVVATCREDIAQNCEYVAMLHNGRLLAMGAPSDIRSTFQADTVVIDAIRNPLIKSKIKTRLGIVVEEVEGMLKFRMADSKDAILDILAEYGSEIGAVYLRQSTLEDVLERLIGDNAGND